MTKSLRRGLVRFGLSGILVLLLPISAALKAEEPPASGSEKIHLVSPNLGLMFFGDEPVNVGLQLEGSVSSGTLEYSVEQWGGEWKAHGSLAVPRVKRGETQTAPLNLALAGPGLYRLRVRGALGSQKVAIDRNVSVLAPTPAVDVDSPWGMFYTPADWFDPKNPHGAEQAARSIRNLGASWVRLGFWENSFGKVSVTAPDASGQRHVTTEITTWKDYARELHALGLHVMGDLAQIPRALSSQPDNTTVAGDGGPQYSRVRPADYGLWEQFAEGLARTFKDEIEVWEIGNEPENHGVYFYGTIEEFIEFVQHTSAALRRGNPTTKIASSGFTRDRVAFNWANRLFELGLGQCIDYLTVHYTDREAVFIDRWRELLRGKNASQPLWNSEENSNVPLFDRIHGIPHSFKFLHVNIGYEEAGPLVEKDYTLRAAGMEYAVGARSLGNAHFLRSASVPGGTFHLFQRGQEVVGVFQREPLATFLAGAHPLALRLKVASPGKGDVPVVTTSYGRVLKPEIGAEGSFLVDAAESLIFVNGCASLEPVAEPAPAAASYVIAEGEDGVFSSSWHPIEHRDASHQRELELWTEDDGGKEGHHIELKLNVPTAGTYEVLLASSPLSALKSPRTINPFAWSVGDSAPVKVEAPVAVLPGSDGIEGGLNLLGKVALKAGSQTIKISVIGKTESIPNYRLVIDAVVLRRVAE